MQVRQAARAGRPVPEAFAYGLAEGRREVGAAQEPGRVGRSLAHSPVGAEREELTGFKAGWTIANQNFEAVDGGDAEGWAWSREDQFLDVAANDDFIGVQAYTRVRIGPDGALNGRRDAIDDGIDVRGYLHWSLLDNYEWGTYEPTFGLVAVDRTTFARAIKPSAHWFGDVASGRAP
ncbi:family 1 glycosylhydrolase [Actinomadura darangshiensis]|uniref:family 1 glycosylhydrolase n=1 Tax=Actinomadura darangshiensis TaxID=705336 RepID=UPI001FB80556|nr:family 1 glycosylhydrolase [Actinomadura darangshiensis]